MTIIIKSKTTKIEVEKMLLQFTKSKSKKSLRTVFGKHPIAVDAVSFQKKLRNEWD
ncbi:hypothetical protein [Flavobacterium sp.]|uniref:hypothetical protein n=1 Tax=Flavobacterium sp. TaxID=239 RepID=UPI0026293837|nr:hypothetical protein [Flavobacterium sp.]